LSRAKDREHPDAAEQEVRHLEVGRVNDQPDDQRNRSEGRETGPHEVAFDDPEQKRGERGHKQLPVTARVDETHQHGRQHVAGPGHECGGPGGTDGPCPTEHEKAGREHMENQLPSKCSVRLHDEQEQERGRIEGLSGGEGFKEWGAPQDVRLPPREATEGSDHVHIEGTSDIAQPHRVVPKQHLVAENERPEEEDGQSTEEHRGKPLWHRGSTAALSLVAFSGTHDCPLFARRRSMTSL
jgi:hypothetical protein